MLQPDEMILDLVQAGISEQEIAYAIKVSQPTVNRIKKGIITNPRFQIYVALTNYHRKHKRRIARLVA